MEKGGRSMPADGSARVQSRPNPASDSFKDDIQAIGRAVERLRDGLVGAESSFPKPTPIHDSSQLGGFVSSSTLGSVGGVGVDFRGGRSDAPRSSNEIADRSPSPGSERGEGQRASGSSPPRELSSARGGGSGILVGGGTTPLESSLDRTGNSNGSLSMHELRSADEARRFYADERARARADTTGDQRDVAAVGKPLASAEKAPTSAGSSRSRSSRSSRSSSRSSSKHRGHHQAGSGVRTASSDKRHGARVAAAAAGVGGRRRHDDTPRGAPKEDRLRPQGDQGSLLTSDGETPAAGSPGRRGGGGWKREALDRSLEETSGDGRNSSCGWAPVRERGSEEEGSAGEAGGVVPAGSGSLFELRDALRSREKELLRLKRDVSVVASSAGGFKHLAASLGSSDTNNTGAGQGRSFAFDHRGDAEEDGDRSGPKSGAPGASYLFGSGGLGGAGSDSGAGSGLLLRRHSVESSLAGTSASHLTTASTAPPPATDSPRKMMPPPPPRRRQHRQHQHQHEHLATVSGGAAPVVVSRSPLVASAHEGLRQMRVVLEQRALEAERAKDDSKNMTASLNNVSARLRRSERKRAAQATELADARAAADAAKSELSRVLARQRSKDKAAAAAAAAAAALQDKKKESEAAARERAEAASGLLADPAQQRQLLERDAEISRLRDRLEAAAGELSEEQGTTASLRARLESSEREARCARERAASAEEEAEAAAAARATRAAEQAREEATAAAAAELRTAEEEGRQHAREAARARESLRVERERTARLALELEAAVRERTQAVEKLAAAEAEAGRLHVKLSTASTAAEDIQAVQRERDTAKEDLQGAVAELANLTAALVLAREGQEAERGRFDRESKRAAALGEELVASEARRKVQEEEIALVRKQVSRLDAKIEQDMMREKAKSDANAKATAAGAEREADSLRASLRQTEAELLASRSRERHAADAADASLKAELAAARDTVERTEEALAAALERARAAEAGAERAAQASRQDKDTLKRGLVASQTACAELRAERSRLLSELEHAASSAAVAAATAAAEASLGSASSFSSPTDVGRGDGGGGGGGRGRGGDNTSPAAARAVETAATAAATLHRTRTDLEGRLALALAEAAEARAETQRLKRQAEVSEREHRTPAVASGQAAPHAARGRKESSAGGSDGEEERARLQEALRDSCRVMGRVATALSAAADDETGGPRSGGGGSELDDPRWATTGRGKRWRRTGGCAGAGRNHSLAAGAPASRSSGRRPGSRRRRRAFSVDSLSGAGDSGDRSRRRRVDDGCFGDSSDGGDEGSTGDEARRAVSRSEVREISERLRFEASRLLGLRADEQRAAEDKVARLRQDLRDSESREAEVAARLEESRELSREQTGFVEGVWKERRRLESELDARREEVERLRASEDAARAAAAVLDGKVEDMSAALRQEKARAKREAEAAVAAEARDAMEALRRQLDDLRKEVDRTKQNQLDDGGGAGVRGRVSNPDGSASGFPAVDGAGPPRGVRRKGESSTAVASGGVVASPTSPPSLAVLEAEFQRLRAKYEKAKGRIVALEELVAASRRVSAQARREFQGALEALKLSQELLLRIHRQRQGQHHGTDTNDAPATASDPNNTTAAATQAQLRQRAPALAPAPAPAAEEEEERRPGVEARASSTDAHVHELAAQASKLRGLSGNVKRLLEIAAGEVQGALEDTRDSLGVAAAATAATATAAVGTQTHRESASAGPTKEEVDALEEQLRDATAAARALEVEKARLDGELGTAVGELSRVQGLLREKTAEAQVLEAQVARLEAEGRETREALSAANDRLADTDATGAQLSDTRARLDAALSTQAELRGRCAELSLASGAFAAEVAKQKEEHSRSQERARLAAEAGAAELRERSAEFSRASEAAAAEAAAERARLEKALQTSQAEAREIDSDVAQVLDALAASEKERRRLEAELDRQVRITSAARVATRAAEGAAAHAREGADRERWELGEKSGGLEGPVQQQQEVSRLKESLEREAERRGQLEKECKALAARAADLEAALISASSEVRKAAKLEVERSARFERQTSALSEETARLKAALQEKTAVAEAETRSAVEAARQEHREAVATAVAEAAERARGEGRKEEQERTAEARERERRDCAALRKEVLEATEALEAETTLRARAAQELSAHRRRVKELEAALERETAAAHAAGEAARKAASSKTMSQLQAEMRSVISSLEPRTGESDEEGLEAGAGRTHRRQRRVSDQEDGGGVRREGAGDGIEEAARSVDDRRAVGQEENGRLIGIIGVRRRDDNSDANAVVGDKSGAVGDTPQPASLRRHSKAEVWHDDNRVMGGGTPPAGPSSASFSRAGSSAAASVTASTNAPRGKNEVAVPSTAAPAPAPEPAAALPTLSPIDILPGDSDRVGTVSGNGDEDDDDVSSSSMLSGVSSTTRTSGMSSSFTSATLPPRPRRVSVVVRGDWKAGQREAFGELDRKASASSSPDDVGAGGGGGGATFAVGRPGVL
eukprot:g7956.t1